MLGPRSFLFILFAALSLSACDSINSAVSFGRCLSNDELKGTVEIYPLSPSDFARLNKKVSENPNNAVLLRNRGNAYRASELDDRYNLALADYNKAVALEPWNAEWYYERSGILGCLDRNEEALADLKAAISIRPSQPSYYASRARILDDQGKEADAYKDHLKAVSLEPSPSLYSVYLARALVKRGRDDEALAILEKVTAGQVEDDCSWASDAHEECTKILVRQGKIEQALRAVADWKRAVPDQPGAFEASAKLHEALGQKEEAKPDYQTLVKLISAEESDPSDWVDRADFFDKLGRHKEAEADRRKALALYEKESRKETERELDDLDRTMNLDARVELHEKLGELEKGRRLRQRELQLNNAIVAKSPKSARAYQSRAIAYESLKQYEQAVLDAERALSLEPNDIVFIGFYASCLNHLKRYEKTLDVCTSALKKRTDDAESESLLTPMTEASEELGRHDDAVAYASRAIKAEPTANAYYWRSIAYQKLGKEKLAERDRMYSKWIKI